MGARSRKQVALIPARKNAQRCFIVTLKRSLKIQCGLKYQASLQSILSHEYKVEMTYGLQECM